MAAFVGGESETQGDSLIFLLETGGFLTSHKYKVGFFVGSLEWYDVENENSLHHLIFQVKNGGNCVGFPSV